MKDFLRDLLARSQELQQADNNKQTKKTAGPELSEDKLAEYTETLLKIFDSNKDGKLQLNEMTK